MGKLKAFFNDLLSSEDPKSTRRFVTIIVSGVFIITCITILILLICLFSSTARLQGLNIEGMKVITELLKDVITWEAIIVLGGLGFIAAPDIVQVIKARFQKNATNDSNI